MALLVATTLRAASAPDTKALAPLLSVDDYGSVAGLGARLARALLTDDVPDTKAAAPLVAVLVDGAKSLTVGLVVRGRGVGALDVRGEALEGLARRAGDNGRGARGAGAVRGARDAGWMLAKAEE